MLIIQNNRRFSHDSNYAWADSYSMRFVWHRVKADLDVAFFRSVSIRDGIIWHYSLTWRNDKSGRIAEFYRNSITGNYTVTIANKLYVGAHVYTEKVLEQSAYYLGDAMRIIRKHYND